MKLKAIVFLFLTIVFVKPLYAQKSDQDNAQEVSKWLKQNAVKLKSVEAGNRFDDLQPLKKILKDVRVVGLGEATHGTREFFQFKHRMLEFLVKEMGFTVFGFEASYSACLKINDYVLTGKGSLSEGLAAQKFPVWQTQEVADLIEWMRKYNLRVPKEKRVKFLGYDIQENALSKEAVLNYLQKVAPDKTASLEQTFKKKSAEALPELQEVVSFLAINKGRLINETSLRDFEQVFQHARLLVQAADTFRYPEFNTEKPLNGRNAMRDYYMAENIQYLMQQEKPGTKFVIWAHNAHIGTDELGMNVPSPPPAMGYYLRKSLGKDFYAFGFEFNQGGFQAMNLDGDFKMKEFVLAPSSEKTIPWYLAQTGINNYLIDFRNSQKSEAVTKWLNSPNKLHWIGAGFSLKWTEERSLKSAILAKTFDGIIFINTTSRARPISVE